MYSDLFGRYLLTWFWDVLSTPTSEQLRINSQRAQKSGSIWCTNHPCHKILPEIWIQILWKLGPFRSLLAQKLAQLVPFCGLTCKIVTFQVFKLRWDWLINDAAVHLACAPTGETNPSTALVLCLRHRHGRHKGPPLEPYRGQRHQAPKPGPPWPSTHHKERVICLGLSGKYRTDWAWWTILDVSWCDVFQTSRSKIFGAQVCPTLPTCSLYLVSCQLQGSGSWTMLEPNVELLRQVVQDAGTSSAVREMAKRVSRSLFAQRTLAASAFVHVSWPFAQAIKGGKRKTRQ